MKKNNFFLLLIIAFVVIAYSPTLKNDFIYWDDDTHLLNNASIRALDAQHLKQIFTSTVDRVYAPLTFLSFAIEYHFFKYDPFIYHLTNLILHVGVTVLVFYVSIQLGLSRHAALMACLLFGVHPIHVESVAWVTERKDVLYAFFYLLSVYCFLRRASFKHPGYFYASLGFGLLSILSKPMALSLPLILLLCEGMQKGSLRGVGWKDKIPYLLYMIPIAGITYSMNARIPGDLGAGAGVLIWLWTSSFYIYKFFVPLYFIPMYPLPEPVSLAHWPYLVALSVWGIMGTVLYLLRSNRWVVFAFLFYFLSMFFLFRFDATADKNIVADRFFYLPSMGICCALGYFLDRLYQRVESLKEPAGIVSIIFVMVVMLLGFKTFMQTQVWGSNIKFWTHELKYHPHNALAYGNRGESYLDIKDYEQALADFNQSIQINPRYYQSYNSRGQLYAQQGNLSGAIADFQKAIELNPRFEEAYSNLGIAYILQKEPKKAYAAFQQAYAINPHHVQTNFNLGLYYLGQKDNAKAMQKFQRVLELDPHHQPSQTAIQKLQEESRGAIR